MKPSLSFYLFSYTSDKILNIYFQVNFNLTGRGSSAEIAFYEGGEEFTLAGWVCPQPTIKDKTSVLGYYMHTEKYLSCFKSFVREC